MIEGLSDGGGCGAVAGKLGLKGFNSRGFCIVESVEINGKGRAWGSRNILTAMWRRLREPLVRCQ